MTGNIGAATAGVGVEVQLLLRGAGGTPVHGQHAIGDHRWHGNWSVTLPHPVGDDRDEIDVDYRAPGADAAAQVILTGNGGNPFGEAGWTRLDRARQRQRADQRRSQSHPAIRP